jgi:hypothetical protein
MSEQQSETTSSTGERPAPEGFTLWPDYWRALKMSWRTEPEIDDEASTLSHLSTLAVR